MQAEESRWVPERQGCRRVELTEVRCQLHHPDRQSARQTSYAERLSSLLSSGVAVEMSRYQAEKNHPSQVASRDWIINSQAMDRFE
jgi:hypothetical protein